MIHGQLAVEAGRMIGFFDEDDDEHSSDESPGMLCSFRKASDEDYQNLRNWRSVLDATSPNGLSLHNHHDSIADACVDPLPHSLRGHLDKGTRSENSLPVQNFSAGHLNVDQLRAFEIIRWHIEQTLSGFEPQPLRMIIHGKGGTGKSALLQTVSDYFRAKGMEHRLKKTAYTGKQSIGLSMNSRSIIAVRNGSFTY